jgi:hypothetical protein
MDERRSNGRTKTSKAASLIFGGQTKVRSCGVSLTDITDGGAGIYKQGLAVLPVTFELSFDNLRRRCRLVWRRGNFFGVAFENQSSPTNTEFQVGEAELVFSPPAFSIIHDQPDLTGVHNENVWAEFSSEVSDRNDDGQADLRFAIGIVILLAMPVLISLGTYVAAAALL